MFQDKLRLGNYAMKLIYTKVILLLVVASCLG